MRRRLPDNLPRLWRLRSKGLYSKSISLYAADSGRFKAETGKHRPLSDEISERFLSRTGCSKMQFARRVASVDEEWVPPEPWG